MEEARDGARIGAGKRIRAVIRSRGGDSGRGMEVQGHSKGHDLGQGGHGQCQSGERGDSAAATRMDFHLRVWAV